MRHLLAVGVGGVVLYAFYKHSKMIGASSSQSTQLLSNRTLTGSSVTLNQSNSIGSQQIGGGPGAGLGIDPLWHNRQAGGAPEIEPLVIPANKATGLSFAPVGYEPPSGAGANRNSSWCDWPSLA